MKKAQQQNKKVVQPEPEEYDEYELTEEEEYRQYMMQQGQFGENGEDDEVELFEPDPDYEPNEEEIIQYAEFLGMEFPGDEEFLEIARDGLIAPLPEGWCMAQFAGQEQTCFFDQDTQQYYMENPNDEYFRQKFEEEKRLREIKKQRQNQSNKPASKTRSKLKNLIDQYAEDDGGQVEEEPKQKKGSKQNNKAEKAEKLEPLSTKNQGKLNQKQQAEKQKEVAPKEEILNKTEKKDKKESKKNSKSDEKESISNMKTMKQQEIKEVQPIKENKKQQEEKKKGKEIKKKESFEENKIDDILNIQSDQSFDEDEHAFIESDFDEAKSRGNNRVDEEDQQEEFQILSSDMQEDGYIQNDEMDLSPINDKKQPKKAEVTSINVLPSLPVINPASIPKILSAPSAVEQLPIVNEGSRPSSAKKEKKISDCSPSNSKKAQDIFLPSVNVPLEDKNKKKTNPNNNSKDNIILEKLPFQKEETPPPKVQSQPNETEDSQLRYSNKNNSLFDPNNKDPIQYSSCSSEISNLSALGSPSTFINLNEKLTKIEEKQDDSESMYSKKSKNEDNQREENNPNDLKLNDKKNSDSDDLPKKQNQKQITSQIRQSSRYKWGASSYSQNYQVSAVDIQGLPEQVSTVWFEEGLEGEDLAEIERYARYRQEELEEYERSIEEFFKQQKAEFHEELQQFKCSCIDEQENFKQQLEWNFYQQKEQIRNELIRESDDQGNQKEENVNQEIETLLEEFRQERDALIKERENQFEKMFLEKNEVRLKEKRDNIIKLKEKVVKSAEEKQKRQMVLENRFEEFLKEDTLKNSIEKDYHQKQLKKIENEFQMNSLDIIEQHEIQFDRTKQLYFEDRERLRSTQHKEITDLKDIYSQKLKQQRQQAGEEGRREIEELFKREKDIIDMDMMDKYEENLNDKIESQNKVNERENEVINNSHFRSIDVFRKMIKDEFNRKMQMDKREGLLNSKVEKQMQNDNLLAIRDKQITLLKQQRDTQQKNLAMQIEEKKQLQNEERKQKFMEGLLAQKGRKHINEYLSQQLTDKTAEIQKLYEIKKNFDRKRIVSDARENQLQNFSKDFVKDHFPKRKLWRETLRNQRDELDQQIKQLSNMREKIELDASQDSGSSATTKESIQNIEQQRQKLRIKESKLLLAEKAFNQACNTKSGEEQMVEAFKEYLKQVEDDKPTKQKPKEETQSIRQNIQIPENHFKHFDKKEPQIQYQNYTSNIRRQEEQEGDENHLLENIQSQLLDDSEEIRAKEQLWTQIIKKSEQRQAEKKAQRDYYLKKIENEKLFWNIQKMKSSLSSQQSWCKNAKDYINKSIKSKPGDLQSISTLF